MKKSALVSVLFSLVIGFASAGEMNLDTFKSRMLKDQKFREYLRRQFFEWEDNDDGRLTPDEAIGKDRPFKESAAFEAADINQSESVSLVEYIDYQIIRSFQALDANQDGTLSDNEVGRYDNPADFFKWLSNWESEKR